MIVPGMLVCSSFLINVCMFIVSTALLISSATVIVRAGESFAVHLALWLYSVLNTVVISGDDVCCSVVFGTLVGVFVFISVRVPESGVYVHITGEY